MGTCGLRGYPNPGGFGPWVARASTRHGGDNPPRRVNSRWSTQQGGSNPPHHIDSHFSTQQGGRDPPCHVNSCRLVCVCVRWGVEWGRGTAGEGREGLELDYHVVFNLKTYLLWGWARRPIPTLVLLAPSPPSHLRIVVFGLVSWACCCVCGHMEVGEGGSDM